MLMFEWGIHTLTECFPLYAGDIIDSVRISIFLKKILNPHQRICFYLFLEREEGRDRERGREKRNINQLPPEHIPIED